MPTFFILGKLEMAQFVYLKLLVTTIDSDFTQKAHLK